MDATGRGAAELAGKVVLVTGAGRGLGREIVRLAARSGATVVGGSRTMSDLSTLEADIALDPDVTARGGRFVGVSLDVMDLASLDAFVSGAQERFGHLDGLVNCTGAGVSVPSLELDDAQFRYTFDFNTRSMFFCSQRAARVMVAQETGGAIVNIGSNFATAGVGIRSAYSAAKAAVESLTRSFAVEWAAQGVRVNTVSPGTMNTPGYRRALANAPAMVESLVALTPSGRIAEPEEVAALVVFLLGEQCAAMTGQVITVDGGQNVPLAALTSCAPSAVSA
ncbi:putative oxidoreductase [Rhodococcus wratislaviensis NBRC 100605]|uniref:Putative oxidoreductase n=2 Tax=Rhodococcus wratislaviensis TaxID=44752 RepID=X0Q9P7_RHOWR|nr:putative oxidoreductase [Rhodococcus wratislaviensis NBRC 100605]